MPVSATELNFLVVDDDDFLRKATAGLLRSLSVARVLEASNGQQALTIMQQSGALPVHVILCDLNMPGMDGMEFLRHLGAAYANVSVIIVSSHDDALLSSVGKMASGYGVRMLGAMHKPISRKNLERLIAGYTPPQAPPGAKNAAGAPAFALADIRQGLAEKQFEPFFQPKIDFRTGRVTGVEALARWIHPLHGIVGPYGFIDALESAGDIGTLTFLMLEKAMAACRQLRDKGHLVSMSVNLSVTSLDDKTLADRITQMAKDAGLEACHVILEITESATMTEVAASLETLARLRMRGFGLSIDDYGTGSSNIQQMTRVPFTELKIDQSFVKNCADNPSHAVIVQSSIDMAHKLKIKCVAEGIETRHDWETLKSMGCDIAQGYFIAKPMDLSAFLNFCAAHKPGGMG